MTSACSFHSLEYLSAGADTNTQGGSAGGNEPPAGGANAEASAGAEADPGRCDDAQKDGEETDIDCGGRTCAPCPADKSCVTGTDCQSAICTNVVCQPPSCTDLALNGDETDLNCGGSCPPCAQGSHCSADADCSTATCTAGLCESETCVDGVLRDGCPLLVDNTPYSLSPAQAPGNCIDDDQDSVADGNAIRLHSCQSELRQTFWAVAQKEGYFAFRSALSGKCLHVRGSSTAGGAVIEQSTCSFAYDQLWKPSLVDSSTMGLVSHFSGLSLNVAGGKASQDGQAIVQGQMDSSADTQWRVTRRSAASYIAFSPSGAQATWLDHAAEVATLGTDDQADAQWVVVPGLNDASLVSFQSRNDPGRYLRHANFRLWSDTNDGTATFKGDATFRYAQPFVGSDPLSKALESSNFPGRYWTRDGDSVSLSPSSDAADYKQNATWLLAGR